MVEVCDELRNEFSQFNDCTLVLGVKASTVEGCSILTVVAQPLEMRAITDDANPLWSNVALIILKQRKLAHPFRTSAPFVFTAPRPLTVNWRNARPASSRVQANANSENMNESRGIILPSTTQASSSQRDVRIHSPCLCCGRIHDF